MKRSKWTYFLLALVIMLIAPSATVKTKPATDWTLYYWFDAYGNYLYRQSLIADEIFLTGLNESDLPPRTVQEKGWKPPAVTLNEWGEPTPITSVPDKKLYSHP
jgi:hypothetical protein